MNSIISAFSRIFSVFSHKRYVSKFIPVYQELTPGKSFDQLTVEELNLVEELKESIEKAKNLITKYPAIKELTETLYIDIVDQDNLKITVTIHNGEADVKIGWDTNHHPDFVLPLRSVNISNLKSILANSDVNPQEIYRIIRVLLVPFLRGLYQADYSHLPADKSYLQLDNFIQVEIKNDFGLEIEGFDGPARATAVNVDNQWLIFEGWQGDPDIRYTMDIYQALQFAYLIRVKLIKSKPNLNELNKIVKQYNDLKSQILTYERSWH